MVKEELHVSVHEAQGFKQQAARLDVEVEGLRQQDQMLAQQVEQQDMILSQLQAELKAERAKQLDISRQLVHSKKMLTDQQDEMEAGQKRERDANNRVRL